MIGSTRDPVYCGVDPGLDGAIVDIRNGVVEAHDMPVLKLGHRRRVDPAGVTEIINSLKPTHAWVERVHSMPKQGVAASFSFGEGYGIILGVMAATATPYTLITPQRWMKAMLAGHQRSKDTSRLVARQLWPNQAELFKRKKDHGRAEGALIAEWGRRHLGRKEPDFLVACDPGDEA